MKFFNSSEINEENWGKHQLKIIGGQDPVLFNGYGDGKVNYISTPTGNEHYSKFAMSSIKTNPMDIKIVNKMNWFTGVKHPCFGGGISFPNCYDEGGLLDSFALKVSLPLLPNGSYVNNLGYKIIKKVSFEIGGQIINRLSGEFIMAYNIMKKTIPTESSTLFISQNNTKLRKWSDNGTNNGEINLIIPIPFITEYVKIPLCLLQFHEVIVKIEFEKLENLVITDQKDDFQNFQKEFKCNLITDYIHLSQNEIELIKSLPYEELTTQCQASYGEVKELGETYMNFNLQINHPVKYIVVIFNEVDEDGKHVIIDNEEKEESFTEMSLNIDGKKVFSEGPEYYRNYQAQKYLNLPNGLPKGIYFYSFSSDPMGYQYSGTLNFSAIKKASFEFKFPKNSPKMEVNYYAINYQQLRIASGMGGLTFSK